MAAPPYGTVAVLGVGLIGGSVGLALRRRALAGHVVGWSRSAATRRLAVELGAIDVAAESAESAVEGAELVYLAVPVGSVVPLLARLAPHLEPGCLVTDAGSSKAAIVSGAAGIRLGGATFLGGHPMAGSERTGVEHAREDLFEGATYVLCPSGATPAAAVAALWQLAESLGAMPVAMPADAHDRAVAVVSHLPHLLAAALMALATRREADGEPLARLEAGSWASATRVAASSPELWRDIFASNREAVLAALADFGETLGQLKELLDSGDDDRLQAALAAAGERRRRG